MIMTLPALGRVAALAILGLLLGALWISVARPIVTALAESDRTIAESQALLARSQRVTNHRFKHVTGWAPEVPNQGVGWLRLAAG